jgi:hypothetical protein
LRTNDLLFRLLAMLLVYGILKFYGGSFGHMALYPVTLLVTFLHEFGHALGALFTGGSVEGLQINPDGSGYTITRGGSQAVVLMGGYLGSAILGNLLFYIGAVKTRITHFALMTLAVLMAVTSIVWFESLTSTGLMFAFSLVLFLIVRYTNWDRDVLMFLGLAAALYIIQDFNVGPSSDLAQYEKVVGIFPAGIWMFIWLFFAGLLFFFSLRRMFRGRAAKNH